MALINVDALISVAVRVRNYSTLAPAERAEIIRMAQGYACKDSAAAADVSPETIRARRKRIYRKLDVPGSNELISSLLALSLESLVRRESVGLRNAEAAVDVGAHGEARESEPAAIPGGGMARARGPVAS
jgi:DNA-binding CsgD family transcriptional regulator